MKKKLLAWCDFVIPTGFGNVAKNLLDDMHNYYDISVVGINYHGHTRYDTNKYFVYSVSKDDIFGINVLKKAIIEELPDILFLFQDMVHIDNIIEELRKLGKPTMKIITYFPIDGFPVCKFWKNIFEHSDVCITYTDWAIDMLKHSFPKEKKIYKLYHGIDTNIFRPLPENQIESHKKSINWNDKFIVCNVNRFQPRKAIPLTIRAFSMFAKGYKICECGNTYPVSYPFCDINMCKNFKLGGSRKEDVLLYLHMMNKERSMGPGFSNSLQNIILSNGFEPYDTSTYIMINSADIYSGKIPDSTINQIYNCSNINISTSLGEGFGLSLAEASAAGIRSIAPNHSAIPEVLGGTGHLIPNIAMISSSGDNGANRPIVNILAMVNALEMEYERWKREGKKKVIDESCIQHVKSNFNWDEKRKFLRSLFE